MSNSKATRRSRSARAALAALSAASLFSIAPAFADDPAVIKILKPDYLNMSNDRAAALVLKSITMQAENICGDYRGPKPVAMRMQVKACVQTVVAEAIEKSDNIALARYYASVN